jgi:hypothetical protein
MLTPSSLALDHGSSLYCDKRGGATWGTGLGTGCMSSPSVLAFLLVLLIPFFERFMCSLAVARLGFKYLVTNSLDRLGHPFKKQYHKAFNREDILGFHISWCPHLTVLACVCTEFVNMATAAVGVKCFGDCEARAIPGPACNWSLVVWVLASSSPWEVHSCV